MNVKYISSGGQHSALVTEEGVLLVTGSTLHGNIEKMIQIIFF